jgi:hypothetical protein
MNTSARRGKTVAQRRLMRRWVMWFLWTIFFPVIGLAAVLTAAVGLAAYLYLGHDEAYKTAQIWTQEQLGPFESAQSAQNAQGPVTKPAMKDMPPFDASLQTMPHLQIDRNYSLPLTQPPTQTPAQPSTQPLQSNPSTGQKP